VLNNLVWNLLDITLDLGVLELATNKTLGSEEGVLWVDNGLTLCGDTDKALALLGETDNRWGGSGT